MQSIATRQGLSLSYEKPKLIVGWMDIPKGMKQIQDSDLRVLGVTPGAMSMRLPTDGPLWIDGKKRKDYTKDEIKDSKGVLKKEMSLFLLMSNYTDFKGEESLLQHGQRQKWGFSLIVHQSVTVNLLVKVLSILGDVPRITTAVCLLLRNEESNNFGKLRESVFQEK